MTLFRLTHMCNSLNLDGLQAQQFETPEELGWLTQSYASPKTFFSEFMVDYQKACGVSAKSVPFSHYDFYYDIFDKQANGQNPAYIHYDINGRRHITTYDDLKQLVDHKAEAWVRRGVAPGSLVCLVYPLGLDFTVGLLAALKLGLVISIASPSRPYLLKKQLDALAPEYISTGPAYAALMKNWNTIILESLPEGAGQGQEGRGERPQVYQAGQVAARLFDFSLDTLLEPVDIACDDLYLNAFRDGMLALSLGPKETLAAPGWSMGLSQPFMLLSVLLAGASFLDLKPELYKRMPKMLRDFPPTILGIDRELRAFLQAQPPDVLAACKFWFRSPSGLSDFDEWQGFIAKLNLAGRLTGVLKWHVQAAGLLAFSRRRKGLIVDTLMPSAGMEWQLVPLPEGGMMPSPEFGCLSFMANGEERTTPYLFVKNKVEWLCPDSYLNEKRERFYAGDLVETFIRDTGFNRHFMIVKTQRIASQCISNDLVIFAGSRTVIDEAGLSQKITDRISRHLGKEYCPDHVVFLPLLPRMGPDGSPDDAWAKKEYTTYRLGKKAGHTLFTGLSRLKEMILIQNGIPISTT